jgi:N-acetylglucosamine malate deacetylase 1
MNLLFVLAHPDDESFSCTGTIAHHVDKGHNVHLITMCRGNRPGAGEVETARQVAYNTVTNMLGITATLGYSDDLRLDYHDALKMIESYQFKPDMVYTHSTSDLHRDHRITAEACLSAFRPKPGSTVRQLLMCETIAATDWSFGVVNDSFHANVYNDVSKYMDVKEFAMKQYATEIYEFPDARSIESMRVMAQNRGRQIGVSYAEAFQLVFSRDHMFL